MEKATVNLVDLIGKVSIVHDRNSKNWIFPQNQSYWKFSTDTFLGSCYTFLTPKYQAKMKPMQRITFFMKNKVKWMVHSPGHFVVIRWKDTNFYDMAGHADLRYNLDYKVYQLLDYNNQSCEKNPGYQKDQCYDTSVFEESMKVINCTIPTLDNKNYICTDEKSGNVARSIAGSYRNGFKKSKCLNPCKYVKASCTLREESKGQNSININFPESIEVLKAYYTYNELSLIAEIGEYVALFLGWSVYQLNGLINISKDSFKKRLSYLC